jgi:hypothetical protein
LSLDHLVGALLEMQWYVEAERAQQALASPGSLIHAEPDIFALRHVRRSEF